MLRRNFLGALPGLSLVQQALGCGVVPLRHLPLPVGFLVTDELLSNNPDFAEWLRIVQRYKGVCVYRSHALHMLRVTFGPILDVPLRVGSSSAFVDIGDQIVGSLRLLFRADDIGFIPPIRHCKTLVENGQMTEAQIAQFKDVCAAATKWPRSLELHNDTR